MISIIIPTSCPDSYLYECLNSIKAQKCVKELLEIIIILNGIRFPYETYIKEVVSNLHMDVKYLYTNEKGVSVARNLGIDHSNGEYIFFLDDDDILSENYFFSLKDKLNDDNVIIASNVYSFYENINEKIKDYLTYNKKGNNIIQNRKYLSNSCCKLIPKKIIGEKRFNTRFTNGEDALFMFSISDRIKDIKIDSSSIYFRRLRTGSASRKKISIFNRFKRIIKQQIEYTRIYIRNPFEYNFFLYMTRLLAVYKQ